MVRVAIFGNQRWTIFGLVLLLMLGCGRKGSFEKTSDERHILKMLAIYREYQTTHGNNPPANTEELKAWAKTLKPEKLTALSVDDLDSAFISPRDNQPYGIAPVGTQRMGMSEIVVYETAGVGGKRMTVGSTGSVRELKEDEVKRIVPNAP